MRAPKLLSAALALGLAGVMALGIAAPADAFQAPPVGPPVLNVPSSVITGASGGGSAGAQLGGQIANGTKGSPAFGAGILSKAGQAISNYNLGTFIGGIVDSQFGIDRDGTVCSATGDDFGGTVLRFLSGAECDAYDNPATYVPNSDAVAMPAGFFSQTYVWGGKLDPNGTQAVFKYTGPDGQTASQGATFTTTVTFAGSPPVSAQQISSHSILCQNTANGSMAVSTVYLNIGPTGPYTNTLTCSSGSQIVAFGRLTYVTAGTAGPTGSGVQYVKIASQGGRDYYAQENGYDQLWFSKLSPMWQPGSTSDPDRWLTCTIKTTDGGVYVGTSNTFKESSGSVAPLKCPTIDPSKTAGHMTITLNGGPQTLTLYDQDSTAEYQAAQSAYPLCSNATCKLDLLDATGSCYDGASERCATWSSDPNKSSKYQCKYGTYSVPLAECNALGNAFDPAKVAAGNGIADPATGKDTGKQTTVKPDKGGAPDPVDSGDTREACFPSGWGVFNPLNWVLQPVKCALNWAFVPRASKMDEMNGTIKDRFTRSGFGSVSTMLNALGSLAPSAGGCGGIPWTFQVYSFRADWTILAACPGDPLHDTAGKVRAVLVGVIWTAAVLAWVRYIAGIFGYVGYGMRPEGFKPAKRDGVHFE